MVNKRKTAVLLSGSGTNLQSLLDASASDDYPAEIVLVISNKAEAYGVKRAEGANVPVKIIDHKAYDGREAFDRAMDEQLEAAGVEIVCLAGFMRLLSPWFVGKWEGRLINIHPSLLPAFKGAHAVRDALEYGVKITGCTTHLVIPEVDAGPILWQAAVPVAEDDTVQTLHARIQQQERILYPATLKKVAEEL